MPPRPRFDRRAPVRELPNINERIKYPQLRVVDSDGKQLGVIDRSKALEIASQRELDLVLVSEKANPPVCRIMDYGKYKFCLLYTSPSPRDATLSRMPSSA